MKKTKSVWETLSTIDVSKQVKKKGNLTYLSWAWAWGIAKSHYPTATYSVYRNPNTNNQWDYQEGVGYMCSTTVIIEKETLEMWLPVMDFKNKSMINNATTFDINKTIMRCLVKNLSMFGLAHYIYANEDLPESSTTVEKDGKLIFGTPSPKKTEDKKIERHYEIDLGDHDILEVLSAISVKKKAGESWEKILIDMQNNLKVTVKTANQIKKMYDDQDIN